MEAPEKVLELIARLRQMTTARGATEAEAATALQKMQKLLFDYNLSLDSIKIGDKAAPSGIGEAFEGAWQRDNVKPGAGFKQRSGRLPAYEREWRVKLAAAVARYNFCTILTSTAFSGVTFIGSATNIEFVKEVWKYACEQVDRLSYEALRLRRKNVAQRAAEGWESGKTWRLNWLFGCVERLEQRLYESWIALREQNADTRALVVHSGKDLEEYVAARTSGKTFSWKNRAAGPGAAAGYLAGDRIDLNRPTKKLVGG